MHSKRYSSGDDFARPEINFHTDQRVVFMTGLGLPMRRQGEPFLRRFALLNHVSFMALDFDAITADKTENENFGLGTAFDRAMEKISKLPEERLILLGPCFGGLMAYRAAQEFPKKVQAVITTSPLIDFNQGALSQYIDTVLARRDDRLKKVSSSHSLIKRMEHFHQMVVSAAKRYGCVSDQSAYTGPIQIIHGEEDKLVPLSNSFVIKQALNRPNVEIQVVSKGKHNFDVALDNKMKFSIAALKKQLGR